jgi:CobQ-like glutamine amidotransferase family enzyme
MYLSQGLQFLGRYASNYSSRKVKGLSILNKVNELRWTNHSGDQWWI